MNPNKSKLQKFWHLKMTFRKLLDLSLPLSDSSKSFNNWLRIYFAVLIRLWRIFIALMNRWLMDWEIRDSSWLIPPIQSLVNKVKVYLRNSSFHSFSARSRGLVSGDLKSLLSCDEQTLTTNNENFYWPSAWDRNRHDKWTSGGCLDLVRRYQGNLFAARYKNLNKFVNSLFAGARRSNKKVKAKKSFWKMKWILFYWHKLFLRRASLFRKKRLQKVFSRRTSDS